MYLRHPPNHMRRKLMSHNQNRLPRKVLEAIKKKKIKEISTKAQNINVSSKKQKTKKKKCKNNKKRRPNNSK